MGINFSLCQEFFSQPRPEEIPNTDPFSPIIPTQYSMKSNYNTLDPVPTTLINLLDPAYYNFKEHISSNFFEGFKSVFWFNKDYRIVFKYNSGKLVLKSELFVDTNDEKCLKYFYQLNFIKICADDYTEKIIDNNIVLINASIKRRLLAKDNRIGFAFRSYRSNGIYFVGTGYENGDLEDLIEKCMIKVLGFHALNGAGVPGEKETRIFSVLEVENCDSNTKNTLINWYCQLVNQIYTGLH